MPAASGPIKVRPKAQPKPTPVKGGVSDAAQGYGLKRANAFKQTPKFNRAQQAAATAGVKYQLSRLAQPKQLKPVHHDNILQHVLHLVYGGGSGGGKSTAASARGTSLTLSGPVEAATQAGAALALHPVSTTTHTVSGLAKDALNLPGGLLHAATQSPLKTLKEMGADYASRYGQTPTEMRHRFEKQGLAPEVLDALSAYGGVGATAGKIGKLAKTDLMTAARPALRTSGGAAKIQDVSGNLFHAMAQRKLDQFRLGQMVKKAGKVNFEEDQRAPAHVIAAHEANQAAGAVKEVTPLFNVGKAQRVDIAKVKSRAVQQLKSEQHRRIEQGARRTLHGLNNHERKAFYAVAEGWAPANPDAALAHLQKRKADILASRKAEGIDAVRRNVDEVRKIDQLIKHRQQAFTPKVAQAVRDLRAQDIHVGRNDPGLTAAQRLLTRYGPQARHLGLERGVFPGEPLPGDIPDLGYVGESVPDFIRRVQAEAKKHGLEKPLYFPHEADALVNNQDFASRAVGGARAVNAPKQRQYKLFDRGTRDTSPEVYLTGLARSIKRKHNWNLISDQYDRHALPGLRNMTLGQLKNELARRGIDPKDVAFWNPGRFRTALKGDQRVTKPNRYGDNVTPAEEFGLENLRHENNAFHDATRAGDAHVPHELVPTRGWTAVPKAAHDEIMAATRPSGKLSRGIDIVNGKQSRLLLGLNPGWNAFQVLSNAGLGALATDGKVPLRGAKAIWLCHQRSREARDRMDALIGEGGGAHGDRVHLGSTANGRVVRGYRNLKDNPMFDRPLLGGHGPSARQLNPFEAGFAFDRAQNKVFRRAVLVHELKKMSNSLDPHTVEQLMKDPAKAEHAAQKLDNLLGDYTSYTSRERNFAKKGALFYGYLRHSLNVLLRTLPRDHPITASILGKLGQLQSSELKKLGVDGLPWADGKFYFTNGGNLESIDLGRANPVANAVTQIHQPSDLLGLTQPLVQIANDQLNHRDSFKDRSWAVYGRPASATANLKSSYFDGARGRILLNEILGLTAPYRMATKLTEFGPQGVDSLPWSQRPTKYKRADYVKFARQQADQQRAEADPISMLFPFLPHPSHDVAIAKSQKAHAPAKSTGRKKTTRYFGAGGGSSSKPHYFGAGG